MVTFAPTWLDPLDVRKWLKDNGLPPASDDLELDRVCAQTETHVERVRADAWATDPDNPDDVVYVPDAEIYQGAVMYAAKHLRRRNSPSGAETFGDVGISWVPRFDPDIDRALHTGDYLPPGAG